MMRHAALLTTLLLAAACTADEAAPAGDTGSAAAAAAPAIGGEDLADVASYELSMEKVDQFYAAQRNMGLALRDMTPTEREAFDADDDSDDDTLDDMARRIDGNAAMAEAVRDAGLSSREFATITMAMIQSAMAASVLETRPNDNQDSLIREMEANPANVRFIREHEAELTQKQAELEAELRRLGVPVDG